MEHKDIRPLSTVQAGQKVKLASITAGRGLNNRLASMGLVSNVIITVISNSHPGPFVINVKDSKMMLGRGMAHQILVSNCNYEENQSSTGRQSK